MDRLLRLEADTYAARMQAEFMRTIKQVAEAVNAAPTGNVISGSEMQVRDLMDEFRRKVFETAVQMRIDSTESSFFPSEGRGGQSKGQQGLVGSHDTMRQRKD